MTDQRTTSRVGVMGGSFDPVHMAHLLAAESVRESLHLDQVLFVPVGHQPLKAHGPAASAEHRVAMLELATQHNPYFAVSRVDVDRPGPSYTLQTLEILSGEGRGRDVAMWFIIGADSLLSFPRWHEPGLILSYTRLAVVRRPDVTMPDMSLLYSELPQLKDKIDWVDAPLIQISATDLRRRVSHGHSIMYRVPEAVRGYIEAHSLYKQGSQQAPSGGDSAWQ